MFLGIRRNDQGYERSDETWKFISGDYGGYGGGEGAGACGGSQRHGINVPVAPKPKVYLVPSEVGSVERPAQSARVKNSLA